MLRYLLVSFFFLSSVHAAVDIKVLKGKEISPYLMEVTHLCYDYMWEMPFRSTDDYYFQAAYQYCQSRSSHEDSLFCCAFDGEKLIGVAIGMPMTEKSSQYQELFLEANRDLNTLYSLECCFILFGIPEMNKPLYQSFEEAVLEMERYQTITVSASGPFIYGFCNMMGFFHDLHSPRVYGWSIPSEENPNPDFVLESRIN